jgi:hypothetical protein
MAEKSPDQIVADIDRKQNEEDRDLIPRIGRKLKDVGRYVKDKVLISDTEAVRQYDEAKKKQRQEKDAADQEAQQKKMRNAIGADEIERAMREGKPVSKAKGGMVKSSASKRADGCAIRGKTRA